MNNNFKTFSSFLWRTRFASSPFYVTTSLGFEGKHADKLTQEHSTKHKPNVM